MKRIDRNTQQSVLFFLNCMRMVRLIGSGTEYSKKIRSTPNEKKANVRIKIVNVRVCNVAKEICSVAKRCAHKKKKVCTQKNGYRSTR